jgi:hypothetical protein
MSDVKPSLGFVGIFVPRDLVLREDLTLTEKVLAAVVDSLDNGVGCWASNAYLGGIIGCGERQVREYLTRLESLGIIVRRQEQDGTRRITTVYAKAIRDLKESSTAENRHPQAEEKTLPPRQDSATNRKEDKKGDSKDISVASLLSSIGVTDKESIDTVTEFVKHREDIKRPLTQRSLIQNIGVIKAQADTQAVPFASAAKDIVGATVRNGWYGLFPTATKKTTKQTLKANDHGAF